MKRLLIAFSTAMLFASVVYADVSPTITTTQLTRGNAVLIAEAESNIENIIEVQASGRGLDRTEAMKNAIDEAIRKNMGTLIMSREELNDNDLFEKVVQVSRGNIKNAKIISEKVENGEVLLTLKFQINTDTLKENLKTFRRGSGGAFLIKQRLSLERGYNVIKSFFDEIDLLDFIDVQVEDRNIDPLKGEFSVFIRVLFNTEKYFNQFAVVLTDVLNDAVLAPELSAELADEPPSKKSFAVFYLLGEGMTFKGWTLPLKFFEAMKKGLGMENFDGNEILQTQKRLWINLALIDKTGRELSLQRIPIYLPVTNILFFSMPNGTKTNPYSITNNINPQVTVVCAPFLGIIDKSKAFYSTLFSDESVPLEQHFVFHLPQDTLLKINSAIAWLNIEK